MNRKVHVLEIEIHNDTAKEAMQKIMEYMQTEIVSIVEIINSDTLLKSKEDPLLSDNIKQADLVLAGEKGILELAEITDRKKLQEAEEKLFIKMLLRYFHRNHIRVFVLVESAEQWNHYQEYLKTNYSGIHVIGNEIVPNDRSMDDMILNSINGAEVDCVISALPSPLQEAFVVRNRILLNTRLWLGLGKSTKLPLEKKEKNRFEDFLIRFFLKREVEKERQKRGNA